MKQFIKRIDRKTIQATVDMEWNEQNQKYLMKVGDIFIYDFWGCGSVLTLFQNPRKWLKESYKITIEKLSRK